MSRETIRETHVVSSIRLGAVETVIERVVVTELVTEDIGPPGRAGADGEGGASHVHVQTAASSEWIVSHNLGFRPTVSITDTAGEEVVGAISHPSSNSTRLSFSAPFAGEARFT